MTIPRHYELFNPTINALRELGGSASIAELVDLVGRNLQLSAEDLSRPHKNGNGTELGYRLAWARTYLKGYGLLDTNGRGVWHLTPSGRDTAEVDPREVDRYIRARSPRPKAKVEAREEIAQALEKEETWRDALLKRLMDMNSGAFERLSQRILRESGFTQVTVTGRSGDGGIDGRGIVQLGGLLSFPVLFQCKRYKGSVGPGAVRDFRGSMVGRTDRGLMITTGAFSRDARAEATRDGAPLIDLVDGEQLLEKLKELRLGVEVATRTVEDVSIVPAFFDEI